MQWICVLPQRYGLSDQALKVARYDSIAMRSFTGVELAGQTVPGATTLPEFRHLQVENDLPREPFDKLAMLAISPFERRLQTRTTAEGALIDARVILPMQTTRTHGCLCHLTGPNSASLAPSVPNTSALTCSSWSRTLAAFSNSRLRACSCICFSSFLISRASCFSDMSW